MAYIDLDEINRLHPKLTAKYPLSFANGISAAINEINRLPNADVVPKSEVEALQEMLDATIAGQETLQKSLVNAKTEVEKWVERCRDMHSVAETKSKHVIDIFEEIDKIIENNRYKAYIGNSQFRYWSYQIEEIIKNIAELKKKYTEGET